MQKTPFLMRFKEEIPAVEPCLANVEFEYNENLGANVTNSGELLWKATKPYTSCYTSGRYVKGHYTPKNKWVSGHYVNGKTDRRSGK